MATICRAAKPAPDRADRSNPSGPIQGMPILKADKANNVICVKRSRGKGFSDIENVLFYLDNTRMPYGDGRKVATTDLIHSVKAL